MSSREDAARITEATRKLREAVERALRADDPEASDHDIAAVMSRAKPVVIWERARDRRKGHHGRVEFDGGVAPATPSEIAKLSRLLHGEAGGAPPGTGLTFPDLIEDACELWDWPDGPAPTAEAVAEKRTVTDRWVRRVASPYGGWEAVIDAARQRLEGLNR